ncbi:uncharacterized protein LOC143493183 [Brachyhypopomus gauderio]|uniref:uncharacterized protein LOC143493183 n=1 Tax=Brachyhypopomus gauderio TaxID=698409 RepID=UPI0040435361
MNSNPEHLPVRSLGRRATPTPTFLSAPPRLRRFPLQTSTPVTAAPLPVPSGGSQPGHSALSGAAGHAPIPTPAVELTDNGTPDEEPRQRGRGTRQRTDVSAANEVPSLQPIRCEESRRGQRRPGAPLTRGHREGRSPRSESQGGRYPTSARELV